MSRMAFSEEENILKNPEIMAAIVESDCAKNRAIKTWELKLLI